ncbi:MAG: ATP binding [Chrysothrix sp. TS-e1954]|nr:MAG: ATP binding [Chrysothrix sp. TS-e1954]
MADSRSQHVNVQSSSYGTNYASPTDSEFSDAYSSSNETVRGWDERRVADWLRSINAEKYIDLFKANHITGENLMDIDQTVLKEIGVKKIGDRVRIGSQAKAFRQQEYRRKRGPNRNSFKPAQPNTPPSSSSPRPPPSTSRVTKSNGRDKRISRAFTASEMAQATSVPIKAVKNISRPSSPLVDGERSNRQPRHPAFNGRDETQLDHSRQYHGPSSGGTSGSSRSNATPIETPTTAIPQQSTRFPASRSGRSNTSTRLPLDKHTVKIIFDDGRSHYVDVENCRSADEVVVRTLRQAGGSEQNPRKYCFHVLNGTEANYTNCRKLSDQELLKICSDRSRPERERLIFRKISLGEPEGVQLMAAAQVAKEQRQQSTPPSAIDSATRSQRKLQNILGESLPSLTYPMSPTVLERREQHLYHTSDDLDGSDYQVPVRPRPQPRNMQLKGDRPESEMVVADPQTYFPDINKAEIEKTVRMSIRRSQRLSRANSRLSVMSTFSNTSSKADAPPVPAMPPVRNSWFASQPARHRPFSILQMGRPQSSIRDSMASFGGLEALDEESSLDTESNRKSYVSFGADSAPEDSASASATEGEEVHSYLEDGSSPPVTESGSYNDQLTQVLAEDGEDPDEELNDFLKSESYDDIKYIRGKLIGQGSFGSVYLALHAMTAELMAVKQVELPTTSSRAIDTKKNNMVEALKREIALLRELRHPHIVQYLGSSSDTNNLNIFLEYVPGGSIAKMLIDYGALPEEVVRKYVRQILIGLAFLHSRDIIHRDIKGANMLVTTQGQVKISDFGISKRVQDSKTLLATEDGTGSTNSGTGKGVAGRGGFANHRVSLQGSVFWMAPEVVKQTAYTRKADIWSLGCLVVEMLTGSHPHPNCTQLQAIFKIGMKGAGGMMNNPSPDMPTKASGPAKEFLKTTFQIEHEERPEAQALLSTPFMSLQNK